MTKDLRTFFGKMCFGAFGGKQRKMAEVKLSRQLLHSYGWYMNRFFTEEKYHEKENN